MPKRPGTSWHGTSAEPSDRHADGFSKYRIKNTKGADCRALGDCMESCMTGSMAGPEEKTNRWEGSVT